MWISLLFSGVENDIMILDEVWGIAYRGWRPAIRHTLYPIQKVTMNSSQLKKYLTRKNTATALFVVVIGVIVVLSILNKQKEQAPLTEAPAAPVAKRCIPTPGMGKQTYKIMTDKPKDLQIVQVDVDPIDVEEGAAQTITVKVRDKNNDTITKESGVTANIKTDNKTTAAAFKLIRAQDEIADDGSKSLISVWESSWTREDSNCHTYMETFTAINDKEAEHFVDLAFK